MGADAGRGFHPTAPPTIGRLVAPRASSLRTALTSLGFIGVLRRGTATAAIDGRIGAGPSHMSQFKVLGGVVGVGLPRPGEKPVFHRRAV